MEKISAKGLKDPESVARALVSLEKKVAELEVRLRKIEERADKV